MAAYEVRCPRCDVSFPVGTKVCVHCGGRTTRPTDHRDAGPIISDSWPPDLAAIGDLHVSDVSSGAADGANHPIEPSQESPFSIGSSGLGDEVANDRELEQDDEPPGIMRSVINSVGGLIWIILLIAFSMARDCGD